MWLVQQGFDPDDWKPLNPVGRGAREIRLRDARGAFRVIYVAQVGDAVCVLHCFQKKSEKTAFIDLSLAARRYREALFCSSTVADIAAKSEPQQ